MYKEGFGLKCRVFKIKDLTFVSDAGIVYMSDA